MLSHSDHSAYLRHLPTWFLTLSLHLYFFKTLSKSGRSIPKFPTCQHLLFSHPQYCSFPSLSLFFPSISLPFLPCPSLLLPSSHIKPFALILFSTTFLGQHFFLLSFLISSSLYFFFFLFHFITQSFLPPHLGLLMGGDTANVCLLLEFRSSLSSNITA